MSTPTVYFEKQETSQTLLMMIKAKCPLRNATLKIYGFDGEFSRKPGKGQKHFIAEFRVTCNPFYFEKVTLVRFAKEGEVVRQILRSTKLNIKNVGYPTRPAKIERHAITSQNNTLQECFPFYRPHLNLEFYSESRYRKLPPDLKEIPKTFGKSEGEILREMPDRTKPFRFSLILPFAKFSNTFRIPKQKDTVFSVELIMELQGKTLNSSEKYPISSCYFEESALQMEECRNVLAAWIKEKTKTTKRDYTRNS